MNEQDKQLLLQDLCGRLPYHVQVRDDMGRVYDLELGNSYLIDMYYGLGDYVEQPIMPYLRPMSSMADEERKELEFILREKSFAINCHNELISYTNPEYDCDHYFSDFYDIQDWLNEHHFDFRGLIPKGLALPAPEGMYDLKTK